MKNQLLVAASAFAASAALLAGPAASAQDVMEEVSPWSVSANVAFTTDYRFRGVSFSAEDFAIQGGFDIAHESGIYLGTWASSLEDSVQYGSTELDLYVGYGYSFDYVSFDIGILGYIYPNGDGGNYIEPYASVSGSYLGATATLGVAYAPEQDNIGTEDNTYVYFDTGAPLGDFFSIFGHVGYEMGAFGEQSYGEDKLDYSVGLSTVYANLDISIAYVDTNIDISDADALVLAGFGPGDTDPNNVAVATANRNSIEDLTDGTAIVTIGASF